VTAMMSTTTGKGYWLVDSRGKVVPFGDAPRLGSMKAAHARVAGADNHFDDGYWLVTRSGRVRAFGGAHNYGDAAGKNVHSPVVSLTSAVDGRGYWLATTQGRVMAFGSASNYGYPGHTMTTPVMHYGACNARCSGSSAVDSPRD
jgi:hypothetical protein